MGTLDELKSGFIESLSLPDDVEVRYHKGPRIHLRYGGDGFCLIDCFQKWYTLSSREEFFDRMGVSGYEIVTNQKRNNAVYRRIEYDDVSLLINLINLIRSQSEDISEKIIDINTPIPVEKVFRDADGTIKYRCPTCGTDFLKAPRCPECGQLVKTNYGKKV